MAQQLGSVAVGSIVKLNENGSPVNYIVVHQGLPSAMYDASCDGTWVRRQAILQEGQFNSGMVNTVPNSLIMQTLEGILTRFDPNMQNAIKTVKIPYCIGNGSGTVNSGSNGVECKIFPLSGIEVGFTNSSAEYLPTDGAKLDYFEAGDSASAQQKRVANFGGTSKEYWTRSPSVHDAWNTFIVYSNGYWLTTNSNKTYGVLPAFILPETLSVLDDGTIIAPPIPPSALTVPQMAMQGNQLSVSWSAVDGADGYILERNADNGGWTQVYSGANTSFEETVGTWTSVQYRVKAGVSGTYGDYTTSASVPVVSASAVVISGADGDLGTLVNDVTYTVSSDGTNPLTVVETINGTETRTFTATNGATNKIPVVDLPTGYGTIKITASTNPGSGVVTVTREWTYTKAAITFPDAGSVADLTQQGKTIWAKTIAEAVRTPSIWGGNLGLALAKLAGAVLYNRTSQPKYAEVNVSLSGKSEGDIISLPENGKMVEFYVSKLDYESALNGAGRVLLVRKNCYDKRTWDAANVDAYATSDIDTWLNGNYKGMFPEDVQTAMGTTKFYYTLGNGNWTVGTLERAAFQLSGTELGFSEAWFNVEGSTLPTASILSVASVEQWTRTPMVGGGGRAITVQNNAAVTRTCAESEYSRPCFTLPSTFTATYYVGSDGTVHDEQEYEEAGTFTDISGGAIPMVSIETGSYVGTGTSGTSHPNALTFDFVPKILIVYPELPYDTSGSSCSWGFICLNGMTNVQTSHYARGEPDSPFYVNLTWDGNSVSWNTPGSASGDSMNQCNGTGRTYYYVAIG